MSKLPSDATLLRGCKSELRRVKALSDEYRLSRDEYRVRATKAEQECAEWKHRFDTLLQRDYATVDGTAICVCNHYKRGETTGGWYCPAHGQQL